MRSLTFLCLAFALLLMTACQPMSESPTAEPADEMTENEDRTMTETIACPATLADFVADSGILDVSTMILEDIDNTTIPGSLEAQSITQHDEVVVLSRFQMPETASALMMSLSNENVLGEDVVMTEASPISYGDETRWIEFDEEPPMVGAMVQYGDRMMMVKASSETIVNGIIESIDGALLDYIEEHPECAYLHPDAR